MVLWGPICLPSALRVLYPREAYELFSSERGYPFSFALLVLLTPAPRQQPNEHLKPLAWLVGAWDGKGTYGESQMEDKITYELAHNGHFLRCKAVASIGGKVVQKGTGMLGYDTASKNLVWHTYFTTGVIGMSHALDSKEPNTWHFAVRIGAEKPWNAARGIMKKLDEDTYTYVVEMKRDGKYVAFFKARYTRRKTAK